MRINHPRQISKLNHMGIRSFSASVDLFLYCENFLFIMFYNHLKKDHVTLNYRKGRDPIPRKGKHLLISFLSCFKDSVRFTFFTRTVNEVPLRFFQSFWFINTSYFCDGSMTLRLVKVLRGRKGEVYVTKLSLYAVDVNHRRFTFRFPVLPATLVEIEVFFLLCFTQKVR